MRIAVAGAHGQIARQLHPLLADRGHRVTGLIRNPDQADTVRRFGAEPIVCDLEGEADLSAFVDHADAIIFAAGAGPGSNIDRKWRLDRDGALKLIDAAERTGIERFVMVSVMNPDQPRGSEVFRAYLQAKSEADAALQRSRLDWTIVRPGRLTDDDATGRVTIARQLERAAIPRADVAATLAETIDMPETKHWSFDVVAGTIRVREALSGLLEER
jgi:uncharacterized protein YbjT (DUF2867 family)